MQFFEPRTSGARLRMGTSKASAVAVALMIALYIPFATAQQDDCQDGVISGSFGLNATIHLCPKIAAQVPGLQRKLNEIAQAQGDQKEQIRELKRLINGLNSVSQNLGERRQVELLKNLSARIGEEQAAGQKQTQERIADLAEQLDDLKSLLLEKLGNASTRDKATAAVDGPVGDAIAQFDLTKAHDLLEDIRVQLNVIGGKVDESLKQEKDIKSDTAATRQILEQKKAEEKALENNPANFARVTMYANRNPRLYGGKWRLMAAIASAPPQFLSFSNPRLQIAFSKSGQKPWAIDITERTGGTGGDYWQLTTEEIGDKAVLCLTVGDSTTGARRQWTGRYEVQEDGTRASFAPTGDPTLTTAQDGLCDGAAESRKASTDPISASNVASAPQRTLPPHTAVPAHTAVPGSAEQTTQDQIATMQRQRSDLIAQMQKSAQSNPAMFGRIDVSAQGNMQNNAWRIKVYTAPSRVSTTLYDVQVQMRMKGPGGGRVWPVQLSNREVMGTAEMRYASLSQLGTEAVVCFTAHDSGSPPMRMTKWYSVETSSQPGPNGYTAAFVPSREATLAPASDAPCE